MASARAVPAGSTCRLFWAVVTFVRSDRLFSGCIKSVAIGEMNTCALPLRFNSDPVFDCVRVLESVVPLAVYTPEPISHAVVPSSMTYRTVCPSVTPALAKV